jgi:hypothetical protein
VGKPGRPTSKASWGMSQSEAPTSVEVALHAEDEAWLEARLAKYEDLLQYLQDH